MRDHNWKHLIPHNENEGPFPTYYCLNCGKFANGITMLSSLPINTFEVECKKK